MVYLDDLLISGNNKRYIAFVKYELKKGFEMKNMEHLHHYLGVEVTKKSWYIFISQIKYI